MPKHLSIQDYTPSQNISQYRITPHAKTGQPQAQLLICHCPRTFLDLLVLNVTAQVHRNQEQQKSAHVHDQGVKPQLFLVGDGMYVKLFLLPAKWILGIIAAQAGPLSYSVHGQ